MAERRRAIPELHFEVSSDKARSVEDEWEKKTLRANVILSWARRMVRGETMIIMRRLTMDVQSQVELEFHHGGVIEKFVQNMDENRLVDTLEPLVGFLSARDAMLHLRQPKGSVVISPKKEPATS